MKCFKCDIPMNHTSCNGNVPETCRVHTCPKCGKTLHNRRGIKQIKNTKGGGRKYDGNSCRHSWDKVSTFFRRCLKCDLVEERLGYDKWVTV